MQSLILKAAPALVLMLMGWMLFWPKPGPDARPELPAPQVLKATENLLDTMASPAITQLDRDTVAALLPPQLKDKVHEPRTKRSEDWQGY